jgi:hypothetical protein
MPLTIADRVRETTTVTGTNDATLLGAVTGFQAFSVIGDGNTTFYTISDQSGGNWEVGIGTFSSIGPTLARTTVLDSSAGGVKVSFSAGTKDVFITYPSDKAVYLDASNNVQPALGDVNATTVDTTNLEVTNLKAKDGTAAGSIANSTGVVTLASTVLTTTDINGGTIDGTTIGGSTAAAGTFTSLTDSGNLTFTGTGNRITGDFSNATIASRVSFQSSTTNGITRVNTLPNGTATESGYNFYNASAGSPSQFGQVFVNSSEVTFRSADASTGSFLPMTFYTGGSERLRIGTGGNIGIGVTDNANIRLLVKQAVDSDVGGIGFQSVDGTATAVISELNSGALVVRNGGAERMRITSSGNVGIAVTNPETPLDVQVSNSGSCLRIRNQSGTAAYNAALFYNNGVSSLVGSIGVSGSATSYNTSSDYRLKENIAPMTGALATVSALKPCTYTWKADGSDGQGFIAHELQAVVPDCVTGEKDAMRTEQYEISPAIPAEVDEDGKTIKEAVEAVMGEREVPSYQGIDTSFLVATLTAAIQELKATVDAQAARIAALEGTV